MANKPSPSPTTNVPAPAAASALSTTSELDFAADAGAGMESADKDSFAIPFLSVLQKGSPQVDEASGVAIDGAKSGMLYENVTGALTDGKTGLLIVPCAYKRVFVQWAPREGGGGYKGEHTPEAIDALRGAGKILELEGRLYAPQPDGTVSDKKCDRFVDTRNHYVLIVDPTTGGWKEALLSLASTQIKKSKNLMSALASVKVQGANGPVTPPTFANMVRITTVPESNEKGTWFGVRMALEGRVNSTAIYAAAKAFHKTVATGAVEAKYEAQPQGPEEGKF